MTRGEIWLVNLDPTVGSEIRKTRPCVVVSPSELHDHLRTVLVAPMTTAGREAPFRIGINYGGRKGLIRSIRFAPWTRPGWRRNWEQARQRRSPPVEVEDAARGIRGMRLLHWSCWAERVREKCGGAEPVSSSDAVHVSPDKLLQRLRFRPASKRRTEWNTVGWIPNGAWARRG